MVTTLFTHPRILLPSPNAPAPGGCSTESAHAPAPDAILVSNGKIIAVGARADLRDLRPGVPEVALPGGAVVAGFHDAHAHLGSVARALVSLNLRDVASLEEALTRLRSFATAHPGESWIVGGRYDSNTWSTGIPTRHDLDRVCPDRPVALASLDGHSVWLNTAGLRAAGIDRHTLNPPGGDIAREADGSEPAGVVRESVADSVRELSERDTDTQLPDLLVQTQEQLLALGITHVTDLDEDVVGQAFTTLHRENRLRVRVHKGIPHSDLDAAIAEGLRTGEGDDWLTVGPVKLFSDGALGSHSAHMGQGFSDAPGNHGIEVLPFEELSALVRRANEAGIAVATHAIGDRANHLVLDAYEANAALTRTRALRNRIEHAQHIDPSDLHRFTTLRVIASLQPTHCTTDYRLLSRRIGGRTLANYAWRSLLDRGASIAFGSDAPIEPLDPMFGIHAAVTRQDRTGQPQEGFEPHEGLSVLEALSAYSAGAAYAAGLEDNVGRIAHGQYADFVSLSEDPTEVPANALAHISVAATVVNGEVAYAAH